MEFWNSLLTEKSWEILQELKTKPFRFILIGGWAAYLWTRQHKSKDIDIVIPNFKDLEFLKREYNLKKNDNLKKYEIQFGEVDVDIYVPHYSNLPLSINELEKNTVKIENIEVVSAETLLLLKQGAELQRQHSVKGSKDRIDIISLLLFSGINLKKYALLVEKDHIDYLPRLKTIITEFKDGNYLGFNPHELKLKKNKLLKELKKA